MAPALALVTRVGGRLHHVGHPGDRHPQSDRRHLENDGGRSRGRPDISRDFVGVGLANVAAGLVGAFPVNASPARSTVVAFGGRSNEGGRPERGGARDRALAARPLRAHDSLGGPRGRAVLHCVADSSRSARCTRSGASSRVEFLFAVISALGVILIGVEQGLAIAVGLAILDQTWRSARPQTCRVGSSRRERRVGSRSSGDRRVDGRPRLGRSSSTTTSSSPTPAVFRREVHELLAKYPATRHVVIDAVAIADIDFTGLAMLSQVVDDLTKDGISFSLARANASVKAHAGEVDRRRRTDAGLLRQRRRRSAGRHRRALAASSRRVGARRS